MPEARPEPNSAKKHSEVKSAALQAMADWRRRLISYPSSLHRLVWDRALGTLIRDPKKPISISIFW